MTDTETTDVHPSEEPDDTTAGAEDDQVVADPADAVTDDGEGADEPADVDADEAGTDQVAVESDEPVDAEPDDESDDASDEEAEGDEPEAADVADEREAADSVETDVEVEAADDAAADADAEVADSVDAGDEPAVRTRTRTRRTRAVSTPSTDDGDPDPDHADGVTDGSSEETTSSDRPRRRRGGRGRGRKSATSTARDDGGAGDDASEDDDDAAPAAPGSVEDDITRVGTRMAARRQQRDRGRRGSSNGRSGRGGDRRNDSATEDARRAILDGPPRTMLVSTHDDRTQIAVLEDRTLVEHYVTRKADVSFVGNIYMGRVQNVLPGMEAAFLDIGKGRNGVLYAGEVLYDEVDVEDGAEPTRIEHALKPGQKVLVQVTKDPMGSKGARLTMQLSLAGRYMVLAPGDGVFGISRKLSDDERDRLRRIMKKLKPEGTGVIVRTAAADATEDQLREDLERLVAKWEVVEERAKAAKVLESVYEEPDLVTRVIRDTFGTEVEQVLIDSPEVHDRIKTYLEEVAPEHAEKVSLYQPEEHKDEVTPSLFDAYHAHEQLKKALERKVWLPSGGYLVIDRTEAMTIVDVNTGRFTGSSGSNLEETVLKTNLEAADEIVRQLRLRDIGGMIIIDFIDMLLKTNQDQVVRRLKRELLRDRTKTRVSDVSRLGLVQMTRKNVSQGLVEAFSEKCKECEGRGYTIHLDA